jgi:very-short-patch-repair endonuclease
MFYDSTRLNSINKTSIEKDTIVDVLRSANRPLSIKEISSAINSINRYKRAEYLIIRSLRLLSNEGILYFKNGKWSIAETGDNQFSDAIKKRSNTLVYPNLSDLGLAALNCTKSSSSFIFSKQHNPIAESLSNTTNSIIENINNSGPWSKFRKIVAYYKECIRNEQGADASAFLDEYGKRFLYFSEIGEWYPKPGRPWCHSIPIGPHLTEFIKELGKIGEGAVVVLGYPLQAVYIKKVNEPETAILRPIFQYILKTTFSNGSVTISTENNRPEICLDWLKYAFQTHEQQRNFLSACGLITSNSDIDEVEDYEFGHGMPDLGTLATNLSVFLSNKIKEPLFVDALSSKLIKTPFESGIYNKAVIMIGSRAKFTKTLLNELTFIEHAEDEVLDSTALKYIFRENLEKSYDDELLKKNHESFVIDTEVMNANQRKAVAALLSQNLSVVTGPPGTGKSQVVCSGIANLRLAGQTAIFASRNHKAIDAVVNRFRDKNNRPLVTRANSKEDPTLKYTFSSAIKDLLANNSDVLASDHFEKTLGEINCLLEARGKKAELAYAVQALRDEIGASEEKLLELADKIPDDVVGILDEAYGKIPVENIRKLKKIISTNGFSINYTGTFLKFIKSLYIILTLPKWLHVRSVLNKHISGLSFPIYEFIRRPTSTQKSILILGFVCDYAELKQKITSLVSTQKSYPSFETLVASIEKNSDGIAMNASEALALDLDRRNGLSPDDNYREQLVSLRVALRAQAKGFFDGIEQQKTNDVLSYNIPCLLNHFPAWAVTNLSIGSRLPLFPSMFDLAVMDEASQSDIPSAIPILFRAKRAAAVGDSNQLTHTSKLSIAKETLLRKRIGLSSFEDLKYSYTETSLYDLFSQSSHITPTFLRDTYRSVNSIAQYSNTTFYNGRLRVATESAHLKVPTNTQAGIHWTHIEGEVKSAGGSGCFCAEEVSVVVELLDKILNDNNFQGTLGIVTPFRQQANRIQDFIYEKGLRYEDLDRVHFNVDTSHGFQGDEKDVMIFSLCAGPNMPRGSRAFLRDTGNLFNVAVSRARAVMHVIGNKGWAECCGIRHIQSLVSPIQQYNSNKGKGKWHPHESPWEEILFNALIKRGLKPVPQYPVAGRRLDMALVMKGDRSKKIDIEIDGDRYHRNSDGSRKKDDIWRDIQLQGMGWIVVRFWVYQLREDLESCVEKIVTIWSEND